MGIEWHYPVKLVVNAFSQSEALRIAVITFQLANQPLSLSMNLPPMFPPLSAITTSVLLLPICRHLNAGDSIVVHAHAP